MIQFTTARLRVRLLVPADAARVSEYRSDPDVARYVPWTPPYSVERAAAMIRELGGRDFDGPGESGINMAVELLSSDSPSLPAGTIIGDAMIKHDGGDARQGVIGYAIDRAFHGQGFGTELTQGLVDRFFANPATHRVVAWCDARNIASVRVIEKAGLRKEAEFVQGVFCKGEWVDERVYAMLRTEWVKSRSRK